MSVEPEVNRFQSFDGVHIAYAVLTPQVAQHHSAVDPKFCPVILHHGFASDWRTNWIRPRVVEALAQAGFTVVLLDARGHGLSDKPHEPSAYANGAMVKDVVSLAHELELTTFDFVGYSMGAFVGVGVALDDSLRRSLRRLVLGGVGVGQQSLRDSERSRAIAEGLESEDASTLTDPTARAFRAFADATKADRLALAAVQRSGGGAPSRDSLALIEVPTLVVNGDKDTLVGSLSSFADVIPDARLEIVPGDHISAVMRPQFRKAVIEFLSED